MKCSICGKEMNKRYLQKIKHDYICSNCYYKLPLFANISLKKYSAKQIKKLIEIKNNVESKVIYEYYDLKIGLNNIKLKEANFKVKDIKKIELCFYPEKILSDSRIGGMIGAKLFFKNGVCFEQYVSDNHFSIGYSYSFPKKFIYYYPKWLKAALQEINNQLNVNCENLQRIETILEEYDAKQYYERTGKEKETKNKTYEKASTQNNINSVLTLENAKKVFGYNSDMTLDDIKKRRNMLLKKYHPDQGGTQAQCTIVNEAYKILKNYIGV